MAINSRWRQDPFDGTLNSILIEYEQHTIEYITELNKYGFYANEGVVLDAGAPVSLVQDNTAQTAFIEQPRTIAPNAGQFRVDYDDTDYYNTGFVQCNSTDNGKAVLFTYRGTGTIVHPNFRLNTNFNLPGNAIAEGTLEVVGNVSLASATGSTITANNKKVEDVSNPTAATDAVNRQTALSLLSSNSGFELLTASSGNWTCPENVTSVLYGMIGGGAGGSGASAGSDSGGGGGGGGSKFGIAAVTPGDTYAYTVGQGGAGGVASSGGSDNRGTAGGNTSIFGITALGGGIAIAGPSSNAGAGGLGGVFGNNGGDGGGGATGASGGGGGGGAAGLFGGVGGNGGNGTASAGTSGSNGGMFSGSGGLGGLSSAGASGTTYGAGGGGGSNGGTDYAGGAGAPGCILLILSP